MGNKGNVSGIKARMLYVGVLAMLLVAQGCQRTGQAYDVVVYGGTPAGVIAAVSASRNGASVLLIEQTGHVGGMSTSGLNTAESEHMIDNSITGLAREFYVRMGSRFPEAYFQTFENGRSLRFKTGDPAFFFESGVAEREFLALLDEQGIQVLYNRHIASADVRDRRIASITLVGGQRVTGRTFIDCSYEGDLMARSGVSYTYGRESRDAYGEPYAGIRFVDDTLRSGTVDAHGKRLPFFSENTGLRPGAGDNRVMTYNFRPTMTKDPRNKRPVTEPASYDAARYALLADFLAEYPDTRLDELIGIYDRGNGKYEFNNQQHSSISLGLFGGNVDYPDASYARRQEIHDDHKAYTLGYLYFLGHDERVPEALRAEMRSFGFAKDEFTDNGNFPYYLYVREARRLVGDYVMTQHDVLETREKPDAVALGSHWIDSHHVQRIALSDSTFTNEGRVWHVVTQPFELPYRMLLPKASEMRNLLVPVCASISHVAFCAYRLESTWMQMGHVAGTAAALALRHGADVSAIDVATLQTRLREEGMIPKNGELGGFDDYRQPHPHAETQTTE